MKPFLFYSCLLVILFQAIFASTSSNKRAALKSKALGRPKKVAGKSAKREKSSSVKKEARVKPSKEEGADSSGIVSREDKPKSLSELLPKKFVEIVIGYLSGTYSILVSTHSWLFKSVYGIAVDSARLYVMIELEGLKGLNHSSANLKEDERRCFELLNVQWSNYLWFKSSYNGRYVFSSYDYQALTECGEDTIRSVKWLTQGNELEGVKFKDVAFNDEDLLWGQLSRNGQTLLSYNGIQNVARIYQIKEEAAKNPTASLKLKLNGTPEAVSGSSNRVMVANAKKLEIHGIGNGTSNLVCRIDEPDIICTGALNEDGSEAAFVSHDKSDELRIVELDKPVGDKVEPAIITIKVPKSLGSISQLVYSDENKLHVLHNGGKVSLYDPPTKTLIPIEAPQKGQAIICSAISPTADYYAALQRVEEEGKSKKTMYRTIVKRKPTKDDWKNIFGYETEKVAGSRKQTKNPSGEG